ncbi:hypothetical protein HK414_16075 [Ramlibacter terrae]|uniref:TonB-dependent receptor n=1 Tax=Ramlibacter terrae TaxID=2732511 RepID=A0ABX6P545_9BURK|nr:hypothetical protein HK414_16075 [Ramlibacter terrae]
MFRDPTARVGRMWSLSATADEAGFVGMDEFLKLSGSGVAVHANRGAAWGGASGTVSPYIDFAGSFDGGLDIATGGTPVTLNFDKGGIGATVQEATFQLDEFIYVSGSFAFDKGVREKVTVETGLTATDLAQVGAQLAKIETVADVSSDRSRITNLWVDTFNIGMRNVDVFVGYGVPDFDSATPVDEQEDVFGLGAGRTSTSACRS